MMKKSILTLVLAMVASMGFAQRTTDKIDRGLVAIPGSNGGNLVSWRVFGEEYYDVTYNLYCNGTKIAENLNVSNYSHSSGTASSKYEVAAVVRGVEQEKCAAVTRWNNGMLTIPVQKITGRDGKDVTANYTLNDISLGDLDGDGVTEFIVKRPCSVAADVSQKNCFNVLDCYNRKGKRLWWIDLGPNMLSGADEQWDCVCYDWDGDGKAEVLLRIQDNAYIHYADGTSELIGSASVDTRWNGIEYTSSGNEYLLYLEGATGKPYDIGPAGHPHYMTYPIARGQDSDWGSGIVGHRSTKHYFGAPFLDGRKASIFLGRGCYTMHKFAAYDVDPATHQLTRRWYWENTVGGSPWFGNGYHNFAIGDVDWDGRDEIIFGSMVIDDNGMGLSTTGFGHGDAQHCADLDPYRKYEEQFACNESQPAMNYRNAVTSEMYYRIKATGDDGRALCANFTNTYPGSVGRSVSTGWISTVADKEIGSLGGDGFISWGDLNQRIYWDGDLLDEYFDSPGTEGYGAIYKPAEAGGGRWNFPDSKCNNWSKNNPGAIADIFGDWREELVMRKADNTAILVYTTNIPTKYRIPTLWHDHQYRNAMVWQSMGYNQPPHKSYFLGELEGITVAPPPYTMTGRTEVANGGTISTTGEHLIVCETNDTKVSITDGASPYMVTFNVPSWVQGNAGNNVSNKPKPTYAYFTCEVSGGTLTGSTRLVKQGDGILKLPKVDMTYTGETDVWAGTLCFDGTLKESPLWLNRFAELNSNGGEFKSIKADYASIMRPGGENSMGNITVDSTYFMGFGSRLVLDLYSDGLKADQVNTKTLRIETKTSSIWQDFGPKYLQPVIEVKEHFAEGATALEPGDYIIGRVDSLVGSLASVKIEGITDHKAGLSIDDQNRLVLTIGSVRGASEIVWTGATSSSWDFANTENFYLAGDESREADIFVKGDIVNFDDNGSKLTVNISEELSPDTIRVNSTKNYTFSGTGTITSGSLVKEGKGTLTISTENSYTGGNYLRGGTVKVAALANESKATGNLGAVTAVSTKFIIENGATLQTTATVTNGSPIRFQSEEGGVINNSADFNQNKAFQGTLLTKKGTGWLKTYVSGTNLTKMIIAGGTVQNLTGIAAKTVEFQGGALVDNVGTNNTLTVPKGKKGAWTTANRATYTNKITGEGDLTIYCAAEKGSNWVATRTPLQLDLSTFTGTIVPGATIATDGRFTLDTNKGPQNGKFNIPSGVYVQNSGKTFKIGELTGSGSLGGYSSFSNNGGSAANTWQVGDEGNFKFDGVVTSADNFTKVGAGKMTVTGVWDNTGAVKVNEGELHINSGGLVGKGTLTVAAGALFTGVTKANTPLTNSSFTINGTIQPGTNATAVTGTLDFDGKNVTFGAQSKLIIGLRRSATATAVGNSYLTNIGTLKLTAGATIAPFLYDSYEPTKDEAMPDSFFVWTDAKSVNITGDLNFELPELYYCDWDTSRIAEGLLFVRFNAEKYAQYLTSIDNIDASETVSVEVVSLNGTTLGTFTCPMGSVKSSFAQTAFPKGFYLLHIKSETGKKGTLKLMK